MPVLSLRSTTFAPGTLDPDASLTATVTVPVSSCASAVAAKIVIKAIINTAKTLKHLFMADLLRSISGREFITWPKADQYYRRTRYCPLWLPKIANKPSRRSPGALSCEVMGKDREYPAALRR